MQRSLSALGALLAIGAITPPRAAAEPVEITFSGFVIEVPAAITALFDVFDPVSGSFLLDTATPDTNGSSQIGEYLGLPLDVVFRFSSQTWTSPGGGGGDSTLVRNEPGQDGIATNTLSPVGPTTNGYAASNLAFQIGDDDGLSLASDDIPTALDEAGFSFTEARITFQKTGFPSATVRADVVFTIPEAEASATGSAAAAALLAIGRRRHGGR